jgi:hypothetical protein
MTESTQNPLLHVCWHTPAAHEAVAPVGTLVVQSLHVVVPQCCASSVTHALLERHVEAGHAEEHTPAALHDALAPEAMPTVQSRQLPVPQWLESHATHCVPAALRHDPAAHAYAQVPAPLQETAAPPGALVVQSPQLAPHRVEDHATHRVPVASRQYPVGHWSAHVVPLQTAAPWPARSAGHAVHDWPQWFAGPGDPQKPAQHTEPAPQLPMPASAVHEARLCDASVKAPPPVVVSLAFTLAPTTNDCADDDELRS